MGESSLTPRQYMVLTAVDQEEGLSQTDLVNRTGIDRSTLADMISRMIKHGLLTRRRTAEDARANSVRLTAQGRKALHWQTSEGWKSKSRMWTLVPRDSVQY